MDTRAANFTGKERAARAEHAIRNRGNRISRQERQLLMNVYFFILEISVAGWLAASWRCLSTWGVQWPLLSPVCLINQAYRQRTHTTPACQVTARRQNLRYDWSESFVSTATILDTSKQVAHHHSTGCLMIFSLGKRTFSVNVSICDFLSQIKSYFHVFGMEMNWTKIGTT